MKGDDERENRCDVCDGTGKKSAAVQRLRERVVMLEAELRDRNIEIQQLERKVSFMMDIEERNDAGWCGEHPRMYSLRPDSESDGPCLMCEVERLKTSEQLNSMRRVAALNAINALCNELPQVPGWIWEHLWESASGIELHKRKDSHGE